MKKNISFIYASFLGILIGSFFIAKVSIAENIITVPVSTGDEITVEQFSSKGKYLLLWIAPEYGFRKPHYSLSRQLQNLSIEVWLSDIVQSLFLPSGSTSIKNLDGKHIADLIEYAHKITGKKIILAADSYASISILRGAHQWQTRQQITPYLIGAILFSPSTYTSIPALGKLPEYMPIISSTNIPIMIYQAKNHFNTGQFGALLEKLQQHGNAVYSRLVNKEKVMFYTEESADKTLQKFSALAKNMKKIIFILEKQSAPLTFVKWKKAKPNHNGINIYLKKYKGVIKPLAINLKDSYGNKFLKTNYKNQVTIINFWATWCPPCVQEIPSLNRLKKKMQGKSFQLISINYAEDQKTILDFMKKVNVEFPVLLDPDGSFAKKWNVITYPSTFVIDTKGNIRYGVNAAIEWDDNELIDKIKSLLKP